MTQGHLYFLTNSAMPGLLKIGFTRTSLTQRLRELDTTGIPDGFIVSASFLVTDPQACERAVHDRLAECRACEEREFFRISPRDALNRCADLLGSHLHDSPSPAADGRSPALDDLDESILQFILHSKTGDTWPETVTREFGIHRQEAHLRLGELAAKGYLREYHENFSLTHKGRKYVFDRDLVIRELFDDA
jgi:T5orf172 domain-containing protein